MNDKPERSDDVPHRQTPSVRRVYDGLLAHISAGDFPPGIKLPSEHEMATRFQVSRPIVRQALDHLRDEGLIQSRRGSGSYVALRPDGEVRSLGYAPVETVADIQRCYEFRLTIEPSHAYWAALRRDQQALDGIATALDAMRHATSLQRHRDDADFAFHLAIAAASNNHYYRSSMLALKDHIAVGMKFHGVSVVTVPAGLEGVLEEHTAIYEAIRLRDPDLARDLMQRHLDGSHARLFEGKTLDLSL